MKTSFERYALHFKQPFGVSSNTRSFTPSILVELHFQGNTGFGEATLPPYLEDTEIQTIFFLKEFQKLKFHQLPSKEDFNSILNKMHVGYNSAKASLDIAFHDLLGKIQHKTVAQLYGIDIKPIQTSFTIGLDSVDTMNKKIEDAYAQGFHFLKIKMGSSDDKKLFKNLKKGLKASFCIDANQGWTDKQFALDFAQELNESGVTYIEQPFKKERLNEAEWLSSRSTIPIIADESFKNLKDIETIKNCFHGVNIKLMKSSGIFEAFQIIQKTKALNLKSIAGCMAESSCGIAAMSQLASLTDWADLDSPLLIKNDPFGKIQYNGDHIIPTEKNGLGIERLAESDI